MRLEQLLLTTCVYELKLSGNNQLRAMIKVSCSSFSPLVSKRHFLSEKRLLFLFLSYMTAWMNFLRRYDTVFHQINIDMSSKGNVHAIRNKLL
jgi:hypothetical protein